MPAVDRVDPTTLDAVAVQLARSSAAVLEASHELLAHYADTGDASTQRAVDTLIDHAADSLRALADSLAETAGRLDAASALNRGDAALNRGDAALNRGDAALNRGDAALNRTGQRRGRSG